MPRRPDAVRCDQDGVKLDNICHLALSLSGSENFTDAPHAIRISPNAIRMFDRNQQDAIRIFSEPTPAAAVHAAKAEGWKLHRG